jgi:hypothetical protein
MCVNEVSKEKHGHKREKGAEWMQLNNEVHSLGWLLILAPVVMTTASRRSREVAHGSKAYVV